MLKTMTYGETSKILTVLSKDHGKISLLAKGARDTKSKYGGSLEPFTHINVVYYEKEGRELQYLSEASVLNGFLGIPCSLERLYPAMAVLEVCSRVVHGNEEHPKLFELVRQTLEGLSKTSKRPMNGLLYFMAQLASLLGYRLEAERCSHCLHLMEQSNFKFNVEYGRVVCGACPPALQSTTLTLTKETVAILAQLNKSNGAGVFNLAISENSGREVFRVLLKHLQYHLDELTSLNTLPFLNAS